MGPGEIGEEYKRQAEKLRQEYSFERQQEIDESINFIRDMNQKWQIEDEKIAQEISHKHLSLEEEDRKLALKLQAELNNGLPVISESPENRIRITRSRVKGPMSAEDKENIEPSLSSSEKHNMPPPRNPQ